MAVASAGSSTTTSRNVTPLLLYGVALDDDPTRVHRIRHPVLRVAPHPDRRAVHERAEIIAGHPVNDDLDIALQPIANVPVPVDVYQLE